jgi:DNA modification methylase
MKLYQGNCLDIMPTLPDKSVDLTVTSPPYDNLRTYNGYTFNFEEIAKELYRVTKDGGVVVWIVGDATINGSETGTSFKQALYFKEMGFNLHDTMIWHKSNGMPTDVRYRYNQCFEYMFVFSKGKVNTFNKLTSESFTNRKYKSNWGRKNDFMVSSTGKERRTAKNKNHDNIFSYAISVGGATKDKIAFRHPAIFPEQLANDHILSWSNEGDVVLDPMMGSGTTGKMAKLLNRDFIGIEISEEYFELAKNRIENTPERLL